MARGLGMLLGMLIATSCALLKTAVARETAPDAVETLAHFLRFKTVSSEDAPGHVLLPDEFKAAHAFLNTSFPRVFSQLQVETVANYSLLFIWEGSDADALPIALLSHQDVVPAEPGEWTQPPFSGNIEDGFKPEATLLFCFGHDEEVGGEAGAAAIARLLEERGTRLDWVLDEGGAVAPDGLPPLAASPVALVSTAEKGYVSVDVTIHAPGGHSSRPPIDGSSVLEVMGRLLTRVSDSPPPARLQEPVPAMLSALAPGASSRFYAYLFRHATSKLVEPVLTRLLAGWTPATAALVRTTVAPTLASAGVQDNVLPETGHLTFNFRPLPGEAATFPEEFLWQAVGDDKPRADVRPRGAWTTGSPAPASGPAWDRISGAIRATFTQHEALPAQLQDLLVVPNLLSGATDSRHYESLTKQGLYRFSGLTLRSGEEARVHGIDERVKAGDYLLGVQFFKELIRRGSSAAAATAAA